MLHKKRWTAFEGAVPMFLPRYHPGLVIDVYSGIIDGLSNVLGKGVSVVQTRRKGKEGPYSWPKPGRDVIRQLLVETASHIAVTGEAFRHGFLDGPVLCSAYPLGRNCLIIDPQTGEARTSAGGAPDTLVAAPVLEFYERRDERDHRVGLMRAAAEKLVTALTPLTSPLRLTVTVRGRTDNDRGRVTVRVDFPAESFDPKPEWVLVRALGPYGQRPPTGDRPS